VVEHRSSHSIKILTTPQRMGICTHHFRDPSAVGIAIALASASISCTAMAAWIVFDVTAEEASMPVWLWQVPLISFPTTIFAGCLHWVSIQLYLNN
jgi:hypothetical protein